MYYFNMSIIGKSPRSSYVVKRGKYIDREQSILNVLKGHSGGLIGAHIIDYIYDRQSAPISFGKAYMVLDKLVAEGKIIKDDETRKYYLPEYYFDENLEDSPSAKLGIIGRPVEESGIPVGDTFLVGFKSPGLAGKSDLASLMKLKLENMQRELNDLQLLVDKL